MTDEKQVLKKRKQFAITAGYIVPPAKKVLRQIDTSFYYAWFKLSFCYIRVISLKLSTGGRTVSL